MTTFVVKDHSNGNTRECDSRADAEETKNDMVSLGADPTQLEIIPPGEGENTAKDASELLAEETGRPEFESEQDMPDVDELEEHKPDGGTEVVEPPEPAENFEDELPEENSGGLEQLGESLETDPLDVLPGYMITTVDGKPSLNKRGVSVLAYHYDISVTDKETVAYPHETEYESAIVEITVEGKDGRVFVGAGEAHVDETPKHQLLRMAETRAYKRAVIFATGTGIVGYQELMEQLQ